MTIESLVINFPYTQHSDFVFFNGYICGYTVTRNKAAKIIGYVAAMRNGFIINERGINYVVRSGKKGSSVRSGTP